MTVAMLQRFAEWITNAAGKLLFAALILIIGFKVAALLVKLLKKSRGIGMLDPGVSTFITSFCSILLKIIVIISAAGVLGIPMASFIAILGSAGVAIGLALQGSLSNIAGGLIILLFKPFNVGDFISFGDTLGTVESIGIFYTRIITPDNRRVVVPNGSLTNQSLVNASSFKTRMVDITVSAGYESDIEKVKQVLLSIAEKHPDVLSDPAPAARLKNQGESSLDFAFRVWCASEKYWNVYFDLEEQIKNEFDKNNISIPYPQMDIHMISGNVSAK